MEFIMAAAALGSLLSSNSARNAKMKAQAADAKLQSARNERARTRSTDTFSKNTQRVKEASQRRDIEIESNRIDAESKIEETFAGSGISGTSVSELDRELSADVAKNKVANARALDQQLADTQKSYGEQIEDINIQAKNINTTAPKQDVLGDAVTAVGTATSVADIGASIEGGIKDFFKPSKISQKLSIGDYKPQGMNITKGF